MTAPAGGVHVQARVGEETYALAIEHVLAVTELGEVTPVPGTADGVVGVRNFHGQVVPVFDLASVVGGASAQTRSRIIVADSRGRVAGFAVDEVTDVGVLAADGADAESEYLAGAVLEDGALVGIVDLERVFTSLERGL